MIVNDREEKNDVQLFLRYIVFIVFSLFMQIIDSDMPKVDESLYQRTDTDIYVYRKKKTSFQEIMPFNINVSEDYSFSSACSIVF
jgi:hypothetical protein